MNIVNCWIIEQLPTSAKVIASYQQASSTHLTQHTEKIGSGASVTIHGMSVTEDRNLRGTDPLDLWLPRGAAGSSRMPTTANDATIDSTSNSIDRHEEFVVSDSISWRQGKFSLLEMVGPSLIAVRAIRKPLCEALKKIEDNMSEDSRKTRLSNEDLELSDQAYTL